MHHARPAMHRGVEPDQPEDISDFERLMNPVTPATAAKVDRNEPCPCGSGKKFKRCCDYPRGRGITKPWPALGVDCPAIPGMSGQTAASSSGRLEYLANFLSAA